MNYKIILLLFFTIFILTPIFALDCQYTQSVFDHNETKIIPYSINNDSPITPIKYTIQGTPMAPIYFFNENDFNVIIEFDLNYYGPAGLWGDLEFMSKHVIMTLTPGTTEMPFVNSRAFRSNQSGYFDSISNLNYRENEFVYLKNQDEEKYKEICKLCGNNICLNDGSTCSLNEECGSNSCINKTCKKEGAVTTVNKSLDISRFSVVNFFIIIGIIAVGFIIVKTSKRIHNKSKINNQKIKFKELFKFNLRNIKRGLWIFLILLFIGGYLIGTIQSKSLFLAWVSSIVDFLFILDLIILFIFNILKPFKWINNFDLSNDLVYYSTKILSVIVFIVAIFLFFMFGLFSISTPINNTSLDKINFMLYSGFIIIVFIWILFIAAFLGLRQKRREKGIYIWNK